MTSTILLTGATDGIGLETAKLLARQGHSLLLHGRSEDKLAQVADALSQTQGAGQIETWRADLSRLREVEDLAAALADQHPGIDVLINNAGVFKMQDPLTADGLDARFVVNTLAPYLLSRRLLPGMSPAGRVVNLSSAAQASVDLGALTGAPRLTDNQAYGQSKLALTMWSMHLARELGQGGPAIIAVNPASFLASKMVKQAYGVQGSDLSVGAEILVRAALGDEFANASGRYYDNDQGQFASPHPDALDERKNAQIVEAMDRLLSARLAA